MPERQCQKCTPEQKASWGCYAKKVRKPDEDEDEREAWIYPAMLPEMIDGEDIYSCPRQHVRENEDWWNRVLLYYQSYMKGHLPDDGGVSDQTAGGMQLMTLLADAFQSAQAQNTGKGPPNGDS